MQSYLFFLNIAKYQESFFHKSVKKSQVPSNYSYKNHHFCNIIYDSFTTTTCRNTPQSIPVT